MSGVQVSFVSGLKVDIYPSSGPANGGTKITVKCAKSSCARSIRAIFDEIPAGCLQASDSWTCTAPAMKTEATRIVSLTISSNESAYLYQTHDFMYYRNPDIFAIQPTLGAVDVRTAVTIVGTNFLPSLSLICRFGQHSVHGKAVNFLSSSLIEWARRWSTAIVDGRQKVQRG